MSLVEKKYSEALSQMTGIQKIERTFSLFTSLCEMHTLRLKRELGKLDEKTARRKVAERLYCSAPGALQLLSKVRID